MRKLLLFMALAALSSCSITPNRMFKTPKDYTYAVDSTDTVKKPYLMQIEDHLEMNIYSNGGFKLVDVTTSALGQSNNEENIPYIIDEKGDVKFPVIGYFHIAGLSVKEAESRLQEKYKEYYKDPFVILKVTSRRAYVFQNDGGKGTVIEIQNDHTTLFEALALAGGVSEYSKAYQIKILRGDPKNPKIYKADISTAEALMNSELQVYPNDIIYIDSGYNLGKRLTRDILPYLTFITTVLLLTSYLNNTK
jgi:polysaccharide export outer membrane protein